MIWSLAATAVIAAARGERRERTVRRARLARRAAALEASAALAAARTVAGIAADWAEASRADGGNAAGHLHALGDLGSCLAAREAPAGEALEAAIAELERAIAEKRADVDRALAAAEAIRARLPGRS